MEIGHSGTITSTGFTPLLKLEAERRWAFGSIVQSEFLLNCAATRRNAELFPDAYDCFYLSVNGVPESGLRFP